MSDKKTPDEFDDFDARLRRAQEGQSPTGLKNGEFAETPSQGFGLAFRIGTELVAALAVGLFIGYWLDIWLETTPWMMVVFFFLGSGAGIMNVYRAAQGIGLGVGIGPGGKIISADGKETETAGKPDKKDHPGD